MGRDRGRFVLGQEEVMLVDVFAVVTFVGWLKVDRLEVTRVLYLDFSSTRINTVYWCFDATMLTGRRHRWCWSASRDGT